MARYRIAIGTPSTGFVRIEWTESLLHGMRAVLADHNLKVDDMALFYYCSSIIPKNRNEIIAQARKWKATHIIWVDDDMRFAPGVLKALVKSFIELERMDKEGHPRILGANCIKRLYPLQYMACSFDGEEVVSHDKKGLQEVLYTGNAFVMMDMKLFDVIPEPWFAFAWNETTKDFGTEDSYFMIKAMKAGYPTSIIHELGEHIDHIGSWTFSPSHRFSGRGHLSLPDWLCSGDAAVGDLQGEIGRVPEQLTLIQAGS